MTSTIYFYCFSFGLLIIRNLCLLCRRRDFCICRIMQKILYKNTLVLLSSLYIMIAHEIFKSRSRTSSSSQGSAKFMLPEAIQSKISKTLNNKDLFDQLLQESSIVEEEQRRQNDMSGVITELGLSPRNGHRGHQHNQVQQGCKCTKIDCLKLYCECFAKGRMCNGSCICVCCRNIPGNQYEIFKAKTVVNYRQPNYFKGVPSHIPGRKCTCKKSMCQKKYCQCYNAGMKCTEDCQCCDCHNGKPEIRHEFDSRMEIQIPA